MLLEMRFKELKPCHNEKVAYKDDHEGYTAHQLRSDRSEQIVELSPVIVVQVTQVLRKHEHQIDRNPV